MTELAVQHNHYYNKNRLITGKYLTNFRVAGQTPAFRSVLVGLASIQETDIVSPKLTLTIRKSEKEIQERIGEEGSR